MSIIFGILEPVAARAEESDLQRMAAATDRFSTDAVSLLIKGRIGMGLQPYRTHVRSALDESLFEGADGTVISFDGRLDNYQELALLLDLLAPETSDTKIVLAAFHRWGAGCFTRFVGDWAIALWCDREELLYLSRDHAGARSLYYCSDRGHALWSSHLDTLLIYNAETPLSKDYVACYLAAKHIRDLTPHDGIYSIPPGQYLVFGRDGTRRSSHWSPVVTTTVAYKSDVDYEEHFLSLFMQSIQRRTGSGASILAQLSGGMDSTAIVCMSDYLRRSRDPDSQLLDTVSFYDDSEASLNERHYFSITETYRGKIGTHINTAFSQRTFEPHDGTGGTYLLPGADSFSVQQERKLLELTSKYGYRSILSGIGGDEILGGIPDGFPELASHLVSGRIGKLLSQSVAWSLVDRSPVIGMLYSTAKYATQLYLGHGRRPGSIPPWVRADLRGRILEIEQSRGEGLSSRLGIAPHRLDNGNAWSSVMETLPHLFPQLLSRLDYLYPFLDRDLVTYLFSIPRDQIVRPGRRRSLMRRALVNIVPNEVLERRRKAFQLRAPLAAVQKAYPKLDRLFANATMAQYGFIDIDAFRAALRRLAEGEVQWHQALLRTIAYELWLQARNPEVPSVTDRGRTGHHFDLTASPQSLGSVGHAGA